MDGGRGGNAAQLPGRRRRPILGGQEIGIRQGILGLDWHPSSNPSIHSSILVVSKMFHSNPHSPPHSPGSPIHSRVQIGLSIRPNPHSITIHCAPPPKTMGRAFARILSHPFCCPGNNAFLGVWLSSVWEGAVKMCSGDQKAIGEGIFRPLVHYSYSQSPA